MITTKMLLENTRDLNVLYVEDDIALSQVTQEYLINYFYSVDVAFDGEEGLEKYKQYKEINNTYYDLVLTDIHMPKVDGLQMSENMLKICETQSILIITAHSTSEYLLDSIKIGVDGFIIKPIDRQQLMQSLFKVSQSISDKRMLELYIQQIEVLNDELSVANENLVSKNEELEKSVRMLDTVIFKDDVIQPKIDKEKEKSHDNEALKLQITQLINDDLYELQEILNEIDVCVIRIIGHEENILDNDVDILIKYFAKYAAILGYYTFFNDLSLSMNLFADTISKTPLPEDIETRHNVFTFLETFVYVLSKWQDDLSSGDESKLNQLDASLISDMHTITNMWINKPIDDVKEEDMDDIFDF